MPAPQLHKLSTEQLIDLKKKLDAQIKGKGDSATEQELQLQQTINKMVSRLPKHDLDAVQKQQDATPENPTPTGEGTTQIWYAQPGSRRLYGQGVQAMREHGVPLPNPANLAKTHVHLINVKETDPRKVLKMMQGENWSPDGSAVELVKSKGLNHVSMTVGDIIVQPGRTIMVDTRGFYDLGSTHGVQEDMSYSDLIDKGVLVGDYDKLAFRPGETVYAGSKKGQFVRFSSPSADHAIIKLPNGDLDIVPVASMTAQKPSMINRAKSWMVGESFGGAHVEPAMDEITQYIESLAGGVLAMTYATLDNAVKAVADKYADAMGCDPEEAARTLHHHYMMRMRSGAINPEVDENIADPGSAGEVNLDGAVVEATKPKLIKKYYFNVAHTPEKELLECGLVEDTRHPGEWVLLQYNTSGAGFDRNFTTCVRSFGRPYKVVSVNATK